MLPKSAVDDYNFALFLSNRQQKYHQSLFYCNEACKLKPNCSKFHQFKGHILYLLKNYEESIDETMIALN